MRHLSFYMQLHTLRRLAIDILVIIIAGFIVYIFTHPGEVTRVSINEYIDSRGGITTVTLDQYFKIHNVEPDENENNN